MYDDLSDHPFSPQSVAAESGEIASLSSWLAFCTVVERLLGHSLNGNDVKGAGCGYSIDEAHDVWRAGKSAHAYVAMITSRDRYDNGFFVST